MSSPKDTYVHCDICKEEMPLSELVTWRLEIGHPSQKFVSGPYQAEACETCIQQLQDAYSAAVDGVTRRRREHVGTIEAFPYQ